jgi:hypothetical protein
MLYILIFVMLLCHVLSQRADYDRETRQIEREWDRDEAMGLHPSDDRMF